MSRPNKRRTIGNERSMARRLAYEREEHGWTYDALARRMEAVGCPIQPSALYKIEKADPPRRVTLDEFVALSNVLDVPMEELLLPVPLVRDRRAKRLLRAWIDVNDRRRELLEEEAVAERELREHLSDHPESQAVFDEALKTWAGDMWGAEHEEEGAAYWSLQLRGVDHDAPEYVEWIRRARGAEKSS